MLLVVAARAEPPIGRQRPNAGQVAVELGREEAGAAHLAVAITTSIPAVLLVADREIDRVVEHLGEVRRPELAALGRRDPGDEPDGRACDPTTLVRSARGSSGATSMDAANAKPGGVVDEQAVADRGIEPARVHQLGVNPSSSQVSPGSPPKTR